MGKAISGTKEWAAHNFNVARGCSHGCRYCYAKANAIRFGQLKNPDDWTTERINAKNRYKSWRKREGRIMFPTTHDITPNLLNACMDALNNMVRAGNEVLIVSKPHFFCIESLTNFLEGFKDQIMFRFTIGGLSDYLRGYWEPGAPQYWHRISCLEHAFKQGYQTSVSAEPLIEASRVDELIEACCPFITDAIWIGKMNRIRQRVKIETKDDERRVAAIEAGQTDENIRAIYERHKGNPKVKWKESIKKIVGLPLSEIAGEDK